MICMVRLWGVDEKSVHQNGYVRNDLLGCRITIRPQIPFESIDNGIVGVVYKRMTAAC